MFIKYLIVFISFLFSFLVISINPYNKLYFPIKERYYITSKYGYRNLGTYHFHSGTDIAVSENTAIYAISNGTVVFSGFYGSCGYSIIISYDNGYKSLYGHISPKFLLAKGSRVSNNTIVAYIGPKYLDNGELNGFTTGPHLHFTLYKNNVRINPQSVEYIYN